MRLEATLEGVSHDRVDLLVEQDATEGRGFRAPGSINYMSTAVTSVLILTDSSYHMTSPCD